MRIKWLKKAINDFDEAMSYIANDRPDSAKKVSCLVLNAINNLSTYRDMGREGRVAGTRELVISGTPFIIPYRIKNNNIEILRVFHSSRKW